MSLQFKLDVKQQQKIVISSQFPPGQKESFKPTRQTAHRAFDIALRLVTAHTVRHSSPKEIVQVFALV